MLQGDKYHLWVPIEDNELNKAVDVDENGDYIVQGVMTSNDPDEEKDIIEPEGMDCTYFLEKGWIKYEHGNNPNQFIGEPIEVRVGRFTHPKLKKSVHGIFVKGRLFAQRQLAQEAVKTIKDLQKSNTKRTMGWSIEGNVVERDRKTGKILKSVLRNVVLTMNPVNTMTWVELSKSFAKNHEVTIDCDVEKSMDTAGAAEITPQSLEGAKPKEVDEDKQKQFIALLRSMVEDFRMNKAMTFDFLRKSLDEREAVAFFYANKRGFDYDDALTFARYIADKEDIFKAMLSRNGGDEMSGLLELLDEELEELRKSLENDDSEEELSKAVKADDSEDDEDNEDYDDEDSEDSDNEDSEDDEESEDDEDDSEETEKSLSTPLKKSLAKRHKQAFEVSDFLSDLTDELSFHMEGLQKSITLNNKKQETLIKSMASMMNVVQELVLQVEDIKTENEDLKKSLDEVLNRPIGRKSVVSGREYQTISKSHNKGAEVLTPAKVRSILEKSFEAGELDGFQLARFEAGVPVEHLVLPESVKEELGLA